MKLVSKLAFAAAVLFNGFSSVSARDINNIAFPDTKTVNGQQLSINGGGLRTATLLKVRVYVAAFYTPKPLISEADVYATSPLRIDLHYVRSVGQAKVTEAWYWQFDESVSATYSDYKKDREQFVKLFGAITKDDVLNMETEDDETRVLENGKLKGSVKSKDFVKAFWSMWFGDKPVTPELKKQLLAGK